MNVVTFMLFILVLVAGYAGWKYLPVGIQWYKVGEALDEVKVYLTPLHRITGLDPDQARQLIADKVAIGVTRLHELGIEDQPDQPVQVWVSPDHNYLQVKYRVVIHHLFNKTQKMTFSRNVEIPAEGHAF